MKDWLKCHHCHQVANHALNKHNSWPLISQVGYTGLDDLVGHLRSVHQCNHQLHHCVFCDLPFTEKSKCIKHEQEDCKNVHNTCYKCGKQAEDRTLLLKHLLTKHNVGIRRKCPHCEKSFLTIMPLGMLRWGKSQVSSSLWLVSTGGHMWSSALGINQSQATILG